MEKDYISINIYKIDIEVMDKLLSDINNFIYKTIHEKRIFHEKIFVLMPPMMERVFDFYNYFNPNIFYGKKEDVLINIKCKKLVAYLDKGVNILFISPTSDVYVYIEKWDHYSEKENLSLKIPIKYKDE